jgi:hypothetical protein
VARQVDGEVVGVVAAHRLERTSRAVVEGSAASVGEVGVEVLLEQGVAEPVPLQRPTSDTARAGRDHERQGSLRLAGHARRDLVRRLVVDRRDDLDDESLALHTRSLEIDPSLLGEVGETGGDRGVDPWRDARPVGGGRQHRPAVGIAAQLAPLPHRPQELGGEERMTARCPPQIGAEGRVEGVGLQVEQGVDEPGLVDELDHGIGVRCAEPTHE